MSRPSLELWRTASALTLPEAARVLRCSASTARRMAEAGVLPTHLDAGGRRVVKPHELERLLDSDQLVLFPLSGGRRAR